MSVRCGCACIKNCKYKAIYGFYIFVYRHPLIPFFKNAYNAPPTYCSHTCVCIYMQKRSTTKPICWAYTRQYIHLGWFIYMGWNGWLCVCGAVASFISNECGGTYIVENIKSKSMVSLNFVSILYTHTQHDMK